MSAVIELGRSIVHRQHGTITDLREGVIMLRKTSAIDSYTLLALMPLAEPLQYCRLGRRLQGENKLLPGTPLPAWN